MSAEVSFISHWEVGAILADSSRGTQWKIYIYILIPFPTLGNFYMASLGVAPWSILIWKTPKISNWIGLDLSPCFFDNIV